MYELIIANKNYSSWSMRPWVLMRELAIPFNERLLPFHTNRAPVIFATSRPRVGFPVWSTVR